MPWRTPGAQERARHARPWMQTGPFPTLPSPPWHLQMLPLRDAVTLFFCSPVIAAVLEYAIQGNNLSLVSSMHGRTHRLGRAFAQGHAARAATDSSFTTIASSTQHHA